MSGIIFRPKRACTTDQQFFIDRIVEAAENFERAIDEAKPHYNGTRTSNRELINAETNLELCAMWAIKGIIG